MIQVNTNTFTKNDMCKTNKISQQKKKKKKEPLLTL